MMVFYPRVTHQIGGNTAGATALISTGTFFFAGGNNITLSQNGNSVTISGPNALTSQSNQAISGSNGSFTFQTVSFGALNGLTFYTSNGSLVGSHNALTTAALSNHSHGNPQLNLTNINGTTNSNSAGFTLSLSAVVPAQTVQPVAASGSNGSFLFSTLSFGALNGFTFYTSNGSIVGSYTDAGAGGGVNFSAGSTSSNLAAVTFADSNGVTFGLGTGASAGVITASVNAGGGALNQYWNQLDAFRFSLSNLTNITALNNIPFFQPFKFVGNMTLSRINFEMSRATAASNAFTVTAGIYSYSNATALSLIASATAVYSNTNTASVSGIRRFGFGGFNVSTFTPGEYVLGMQFSAAGGNTASMNYSIRGYSGLAQAGAILEGSNQYNTATSYNIFPFFGRFTTTTGVFLTSVADSQVRGQFSGASSPINAWIGFNND